MDQTISSQSSDSAYRHPGQRFSKQHGIPTRKSDLLNYPKFLRAAAGLTEQPPIDLAAIYQHFGMAEPIRAPLVDQQGILVDASTGLILIKEDDAIARQRFTEGHELMELLFDAIEQASEQVKEQAEPFYYWDHDEKERLCDQGAAELLMPRSQFTVDLQAVEISLARARSLAKLSQTSLMATLIQMMKSGSGSYALVLWHPALRKQEQIAPKSVSQKSQKKPAKQPQRKPKKKQRVWWRCCTQDWTGGFIPPNKSVPSDSLIAQAHRDQQTQIGTELLPIRKSPIHCRIELLPIQTNQKSYVLSLLHPLDEKI